MEELKVLINDIETYDEMFLNVYYHPVEKRYYRFEVSRWKNELDGMMKFIESYSDYYIVTFNGLSFDSQVIEWIIKHYQEWWDLSGLEIAGRIAQFAKDRIDDSNYEIFPPYKEEQLSMKQIDLFTIWHFNNINRRTSLKAIEYALQLPNIEETPVPFDKKDLTRDEAIQVIDYCINDVKATYEFYLLTRGQTDNPIYKGKDKIADRFIMEEEFGLKCLNWDDVKIGAEWNKLDYIELTKRREDTLKPKKKIHFYGKQFSQFFPPVSKEIKAQTPELRKFIREFGKTYALNKKQEFKYTFKNGLVATIAKGGIHSNEKARFIKPSESETYEQVDIGSQYPNAIRKYKVEPRHLPGWNNLIVSKIDRRLNYKKQYKETGNPKFNSMQEMGKLALNGGSYGRLNTKGDWQEYPYGMLQVTIGGQIELLLITEDLVLKGFNVVSLNTDGFDVVIKTKREKEFRDILTNWETLIGNDVLGNFEYTKFKWIAQTSVNDYLAMKEDGTVKAKGDFEINKEIHKNSSMKIVPIALTEYFVNNIPVEETIKNHKNIYNFTLRQKSSSNFHYEGINPNPKYKKATSANDLLNAGWINYYDGWIMQKWQKEGLPYDKMLVPIEEALRQINEDRKYKASSKTIYNKLIRYYVSNTGEKLLKIKNPECTTNAPKVSQVHAGDWLCTVVNKLDKNHPLDNINHSFYIEKAMKIVNAIRYEGKKIVKKDVNQLELKF